MSERLPVIPEGEEPMEITTYEDFRNAVAVFGNDYSLVHTNGETRRSPFDEPNAAGQYSLVEIPDQMSEQEFLEKLAQMTDICITCMDKHCAHSTWSKLKTDENKVAMFSWGGGVVQDGVERTSALKTIVSFFAEKKLQGKLPNLKTVHLDDHDNTCGAVTFFLGGVTLSEVLTQHYNKPINPHSPEEDDAMCDLIRDGALLVVDSFVGTGVDVVAHLHFTDREGNGQSNLIEIGLGPDQPRINVAALRKVLLPAVEKARAIKGI